MEREEVIKNVRACLISSKGGVKMDDLNSKFFLLRSFFLSLFNLIIIYLNFHNIDLECLYFYKPYIY